MFGYLKFICIDVEHAKIARLQLEKSGRRAVVTYIEQPGVPNEVVHIHVVAMAYTDTVSDYDKRALENDTQIR